MDAAQRMLVASGPKGIRLQDVAAEVGISHPTVLHHFGSRERLVDAVVKRRVASMNEDVIRALAGAGPDAASAVALFERLFETLGPGGHARVAAFIALEGRVPGAEPNSLRPLAEATHAARLAHSDGAAAQPVFEETYFIMLLATFALFGEAILGPLFRGEPEDAPDEAASKRFRDWTARLIREQLANGTTLRAAAPPKKTPAPRKKTAR